MKRIVVMVACLALLATAAAFTGGKSEKAAAAADRVTVWVPQPMGAVQSWATDPILAEIERRTGLDITIENLDWGAFMDSITTSVASRTLPDIAGVTDPGQRGVLERWIADGVLAPFEGAVAEAAPNVIRQYEVNPSLAEIKVDGKIYFQPIGWGDEMYPNMGLFHVRRDLLEKYGMSPPDTFEQFFSYVSRAHSDGDGRVVFGGQGGVGSAITAFAGAFGVPHTGWVRKGNSFEHYSIQSEMKNALLLFREMATRGLISPASWESGGDDARAAYVSGNAAALIWNGGGHIGRIQNDMQLVDPNMQNLLLPAPRHRTAQRGYTAEPMFWGFSWLGGMSHNNPVGAAKVINYLISEEGYRLTAIGVEGSDFRTVNGEIELLPARQQRGFPTEAGDTGAHPLATGIVSWVPQEWQNFQLMYGRGPEYRAWFEQMWENQGRYQTQAYGILTTTPKWSEFQATGNELTARAYLAIVQAASTAEAERLFDAYVRDWLAAGGREAQAEMSAKLSQIYR